MVGSPLALLLRNRKHEFIVCDDKTKNLKQKTKKADVLISATGTSRLVKGDFVKKGAVVVDAGFASLNGKMVGDVDFSTVKKQASRITPVPGGVGPMIVAMLIENIIEAYKSQYGKN